MDKVFQWPRNRLCGVVVMKKWSLASLSVVLAIVLLVLPIVGCGLPGDPVVDDIYSQDIYPGTDQGYDLGSEDYRYDDIYGTNLNISGIATIDDLTGTLRADAGLLGIDLARATISTENRAIYVDKEAIGTANGSSWADAFTTIQAAVNDLEDIVVHAHTIYVRDGTKKTGTADDNVLNQLGDTSAPFVAGDVGKRVFNVGTSAWGVAGSFVDTSHLGIVDTAGANLDLFPAGTEAYVMEATPYREIVYLNSLPATNPTKTILGSLSIQAEYFWYAACDANANAGEIKDASYTFTGIEVGDTVFVLDLNGANGRVQDVEIGYVDDVSQIGSNIVRTTLTKTPTTNWRYTIVKTEISGSDDSTSGGKARNECFQLNTINNVTITGFYLSWSDVYAIDFLRSISGGFVKGIIFDNCDYGFSVGYHSSVDISYSYVGATSRVWYESVVRVFWGALAEFRIQTKAVGYVQHTHWLSCNIAMDVDRQSFGYPYGCTIPNTVTTGLKARYNSSIKTTYLTNSATIPVNPIGTSEGAYIQ